MHKESPHTKRHVAICWPGSTRLMPWVFSLAVVLVLIFARPVSGRWEILQTVETAETARSLGGEMVVFEPTPTPIIPKQARVPILMYHYVSDVPPGADRLRRDLTVSPEMFRAQLQYLADAGYHPITLTDLYLYLTQGYPLPDKPVVLTFDDGYRDAYEVVFPLLVEYGFPGTFFVLATPMHQESVDYITWVQAKEMSDAGMAIEGHGRDHVDLRGRSNDYLVYQTLGIQEAIYYHTGRLPRFFAYPSGQYDANVIAVLKSAGYWGAVTTDWGKEHTLGDMFEMERVRIRGSDTMGSFVDKLEDDD
ncbi:MAG: polysaccharide deacetylase family protein [Anaerolineae bacterium]|jgi:peptidoglycan/xylan/chitin deacetylase (PgdA/CDA1 family)